MINTKKSKIILIIAFIFVIIFVILRIEEDTWICQDGQWEKHGMPSVSMPEHECNWLDNLNPFK